MSYHLQSEGPKVGTWTSKVGKLLPKNPEQGKLDQYSTDNRYLITLSLWNWSLVWVPRAGDPSEFIDLGILGS